MTVPREINPSNEHPQLRPIATLFSEQVTRDPEACALTFDGVTHSRRAFQKEVMRRAHALSRAGVIQNDFVSVALPNGINFHAFVYAIWCLGAVPAPLYHGLPAPELDAILSLAKPRLVLSPNPERLLGFDSLPAEYLADADPDWNAPGELLSPHMKAITSGGSTGRPKLIVDQRPAVLDARLTSLGLELDDVVLNCAPTYHNAPFCFSNWAMAWGGHVVETARFDAVETLRLIEQYRIRWVYLVPTMMSRIWNLPDTVRKSFDLSSVEMVMHMAAPCPVWLKEAWIDWLGPERIGEIYAGTESIGGAYINGREWLQHRGSVGRPLGKLHVLDDDGQEVAAGVIGELYFEKPRGTAKSYAYRGSERRSKGAWESYGDMGHVDDDGYLYLADRRTDMIVSGGANIYPAEVESALESHPSIQTAIAVGLPHPDWGQSVHAILQLEPGADAPTRMALRAFVEGKLARYKRPSTFELTQDALRNEAGKVRRSALRDQRLGLIQSGVDLPFLG